MRAAISRCTVVVACVVAGLVAGLGCFGGRALTDPTTGGPGESFRPTEPHVVALALSPASLHGRPGQSVQMTATAKSPTGQPVPGVSVDWSASDTSVVTVGPDGTVHFKRHGRARVRATLGSVTDSVGATVDTQTVADVQVSPTAISGIPGTTKQVTATAQDSSGAVMTGQPESWSSSNTGVATVSTGGVVTLVGVGAATVTVDISGVTAPVAITVTAAPPPAVASVSLAPTSVSGLPGDTRQVTATPKDAAGSPVPGASVSWSSSNTTVATVSGGGLVALKHAGTATITATAGGVSAALAATVNAPPPPPVASVTLSPAAVSGAAGLTQQVTATARDSTGATVAGQVMSWTSSNPGVATVSSSGLVTLVHQGTATIAASTAGVRGTMTATVTAPPPAVVAALAVSPTSASLGIGQTAQFAATARDAAGNVLSGAAVTWASATPGVASVSSSGLVTAIAIGSAVVSATSGGISATATIQVVAAQSGGTHEPSGMTTVLATGPITSGAPTSPAGSNGTSWSSGGPVPTAVTIIQSPTGSIQLSSSAADEPQPSGWRVTLPAGQVNDPAMALGMPWSSHGHGTLYMRYKLRLGSNWSAAGMHSNAAKLFAPKDDGGSDDIVMAYLDPGNGIATPGYGAGVGLQGPETMNIPANTEGVIPANDVYRAGVWNTFEVLITPDSPAGAGNGSVEIWVNGGTPIVKSGVSIFRAGAAMGWHELQMYVSRAVYSGTQSSTTYLDVDDIYASVK